MSRLRISFALPPIKDAPGYARLAEDLGFDGVFLYDSPALYGDIWAGLGRIADVTSRIGLGTAVAVPALRHPMVTASAIATIEELAPGRLTCGFGAGWSARFAMGRRAMRWEEMRRFFIQLRGLLQGETVEIDGAKCQMLHSPGFGPKRPLNTPLIAAASGPKGYEVARAVADGVFCDREIVKGFDRCLNFTVGTVLDPGEDHTSARLKAALGPLYVTQFHGMWEMGAAVVDSQPGGAQWRASVEAERPDDERHLAIHEGHMCAVTARDRALLAAAGPALLGMGITGSEEAVRAKLAQISAAGASEVVIVIASPDVPRELRAFARAARL